MLPLKLIITNNSTQGKKNLILINSQELPRLTFCTHSFQQAFVAEDLVGDFVLRCP